MGGKQIVDCEEETHAKAVTRKRLREMIQEQGYQCALSGWQLSPPEATLDHVQPVAKGGALKDINNIQIVHATINRMKGSMSQAEFVAACQAVAERHPKRK